MSALESMLAQQMFVMGLDPPEREYRFCAHLVGTGRGVKSRLRDAGLRDWRFDFAWPASMFAVEVEGGAFTGGRHTRGLGFTEDCRKYHHAMLLGWTVYRCERRLIASGDAARLVERMLGAISSSDVAPVGAEGI